MEGVENDLTDGENSDEGSERENEGEKATEGEHGESANEELEDSEENQEPDNMPEKPEESLRSKFLLAEYNALTKQVEKLLAETDTLAKYALVGTVSVWTWFATHSEIYCETPALLWMPTLFCVILGIRALILTDLIIEVGRFIAGIEAGVGIFGWERHVEEQRKTDKYKGQSSLRYKSARWFWILLVIATALVPIVFLCSHECCSCH